MAALNTPGILPKQSPPGANSVMIGNLFAGCDESPGEFVLFQGRTFKAYRGMGSLGAMEAGSSDRYSQETQEQPAKLIPEGIEGRMPHKGPLETMILQLVGGLKSGMGYCGAATSKNSRPRLALSASQPDEFKNGNRGMHLVERGTRAGYVS